MTADRTAGIGALLLAESLAIVGASDDPTRIGGRPVAYLRRAGFAGRLYPVNPNRSTIQGLTAYPSIEDLPETPDAAMILVPSSMTVEAVRSCARRGVKVAIVSSAGFAEMGDEGRELQSELEAISQQSGMRLLGPNCLGVFNSGSGFFPTFATALSRDLPEPGPIGVVSQSGAYGAHAVYLAQQRGCGVRYMVTTGNESDLDISDAIEWMAERPEVSVILAYAEGISDGDRFVRALRRAQETRTRIVFLKVGSSDAGARAAQSHTDSLAGADEVFDGVCAQFGVYRAHSTEEQVDIVYALAHGLAPAGDRLGIVTVSGGAGVHLCDGAERHGLSVPTLDARTQKSIVDLLPYASASNPIDVTAQSLQKVDLLTHAISEILHSRQIDVLVAYFTTTLLARAFSEQLREAIRKGAEGSHGVPIVLVMVADPDVVKSFEEDGFLVYEDTERAVRAIAAAQRLASASLSVQPDVPPGEELVGPFSEFDAGRMLEQAGVPMLAQTLVTSTEGAVQAASRIGFPVAMKVSSPDIQHKSDIGGVVLGISDAQAAGAAYERIRSSVSAAKPDARIDGVVVGPMVARGVEVIAGLVDDPIFGPVVMAGLGGVLVEVLQDVSFRRAPIDEKEADRMLQELRGRALLDGVRGAQPVDRDALTRAIAALSRFGAAHRGALATVEINPLSATPDGVLGLDAVVVTHDASMAVGR